MNIYAKDITKSNVVDLVDMRKKYNLKGSDLSAQIGCDHAIYIIFEDWTHRPILTESRIIRFELDWSSGPKTKNIEILDFSSNFTGLHFILPIGKNYLVNGRFRDNIVEKAKDENGKYSFITDSGGNIIRKIFLGWINTKTIMVNSNDRIIVGYYDEAIFDLRDDRTKSGLIVYDAYGKKLWENKKYPIANCYALDIDDDGNIWFYPDDKIIKIDPKTNYDIYDVGIKSSCGFLYNKNKDIFIFEDGYPHENKFIAKDFANNRFSNERPCIFTHGGEPIDVEGFAFRNSKALLWNKNTLYWFDWK